MLYKTYNITEAAMKLEVKRVGNSTGLILPKDFLAKLNLAQGDWLYVTENADGSVRLSPYDPTFEKGMKVAEKAMKTYRNALSELAK
ncbi:MAG: transcriptional regulator/antitoxin, MazE [Methylobacterium brachiatum]|nr:transcriptional regulator/antitoxin, MazE [Methylobacterium brachiatum]